MHSLGLIEDCKIDLEKLKKFVDRIAAGYLSSNPYHSQIHAADVVQGTYWYIKAGGLRDLVSRQSPHRRNRGVSAAR